MASIEFTKYEAAGNDFLVPHDPAPEIDQLAINAPRLCDRRRGVGADGVLHVTHRDRTWAVAVINADGSIAETSGNGLRCAVHHLLLGGHVSPDSEVDLLSGAGPVAARLRGGRIQVNMGPPRFRAANLPPGSGSNPIRVDVGEYTGVAVSMGNPHLVVDIGVDPATFELSALSNEAEGSFPDGVNVEIASWDDGSSVRARVWERGVGETLACGSGACAIAAALAHDDEMEGPLDIQMPGGTLRVTWEGCMPADLWLSGPVRRVFHGEVTINESSPEGGPTP